MKSNQGVKQSEQVFQKTTWILLLATVAGFATVPQTEAATNVVLWDTGSRLTDTLPNRAGWKAVPSELFVFEAEPSKAASDPGYYGREYSFKGDAVVENHSFTSFFCSDKGRVVLYSKPNIASSGDALQGSALASQKAWEFVPLKSRSQKITR